MELPGRSIARKFIRFSKRIKAGKICDFHPARFSLSLNLFM